MPVMAVMPVMAKGLGNHKEWPYIRLRRKRSGRTRQRKQERIKRRRLN